MYVTRKYHREKLGREFVKLKENLGLTGPTKKICPPYLDDRSPFPVKPKILSSFWTKKFYKAEE